MKKYSKSSYSSGENACGVKPGIKGNYMVPLL